MSVSQKKKKNKQTNKVEPQTQKCYTHHVTKSNSCAYITAAQSTNSISEFPIQFPLSWTK